MYELKIIRLLRLSVPDSPDVQNMVTKTLERLKITCFGYQDDGLGECFDTSLCERKVWAASFYYEWAVD